MKVTKFIHDNGDEETCNYQIVEYPHTRSNGTTYAKTGIRVYSKRKKLSDTLFDPQDPRLVPFGGGVTLPSKLNDE